jgi:hypothetical protein
MPVMFGLHIACRGCRDASVIVWPVLEVRSYDTDGLLDEAATCVRTSAAEWARCQY